MKLTAKMVKDAARKAGCGDVGIANIERFENAPRMMHPKNIFPDCRSVISIVQPIPRGSYRGVTEGTHWPNYTFYAYCKLNTLFRPLVIYKTSCFIEDNGFEAVPVFPAVAESHGTRPPVAPDRPSPDIDLNVRVAAVACGLGEMGWSKVFLHKKFGPRVRIGTILTDAELDPDPLVEPNTLCNKCMQCVKHCPGQAIPKPNETPTIKIQIEDKTYEWADVHMGRCTLTHHGLNWKSSPFLLKDFPGLNLDVPNTDLSEEEAYKLAYSVAQTKWRPTLEFNTDSAVKYYNDILSHTGYFAVCGAKGCIRACMNSMEKRNAIEQSSFKTPLNPRPHWKLTPTEKEKRGGPPEKKFPELFHKPDKNPGTWK